MQILRAFLMASYVALVLACVPAIAQDFKQYPGSKLDDKASREASSTKSGIDCQVFTTPDSFDKLYAFYKAMYKEQAWPVHPPKLPSGQEIRWAFFLIDGAKDLAHSKLWMKIQRPYIGTVDGNLDFKDIRDISVIQTVHKN
jgi:hypothetical protein